MSGFRARVAHGAKWSVLARLVRTLVGIGTLAVLSRFLEPGDFGLVALIMFIAMISQVFSDFGTRSALIQRQTINEIETSSVFWANVALALAMTALCLALATPLATLFDAPGMEAPLRWFTPIFLLTALQGVPAALLERRLAFERLALIEMVAGIAGALTAVALVLAGARVGALICQQLVIAAIMTALILASARWRPTLGFSWSALGPLLRYGGYIAASGMVYFAADQGSRPIIAAGLSAAALGYYTVGQQIITAPLTMLVQVAQRILFPVMSSFQNDHVRMRRAHAEALHALMTVMTPVCIGIAAVSDPMVKVLLGPGWETVGALLIFLALQALLVAFGMFNLTIIAATGQARLYFWLNVLGTVLKLGALILALPYGVVAVVASHLVVACIMVPIRSVIAFRAIGQSFGDVMRVIARPLSAGCFMGILVLAVRSRIDMAPLPTLVVCVAVGVAAYAAAALVVDRRHILDLARVALKRA